MESLSRDLKLAAAKKKLKKYQQSNKGNVLKKDLGTPTSAAKVDQVNTSNEQISQPASGFNATLESDSLLNSSSEPLEADNLRMTVNSFATLNGHACNGKEESTNVREEKENLLMHENREPFAHDYKYKIEWNKMQEELVQHQQTINVMVFEKNELQVLLQKTNALAEQRNSELLVAYESLQKLEAQLAHISVSQRHTQLLTKDIETLRNEHAQQLSRLREELGRAQQSRDEALDNVHELKSRLQVKVAECVNALRQIDELKNQVELAQVYSSQVSSAADGRVKEQMEYVARLEFERSQLLERVEQYDLAVKSLTEERQHTTLHYRALANQQHEEVLKLQNENAGLLGEKMMLMSQVNEHNELEAAACLRAQSTNQDRKEPVEQVVQQHLHEQHLTSLELALMAASEREAGLSADNAALNQLAAEAEKRVELLTQEILKMRQEHVDPMKLLDELHSNRTTISRALSQNKNLKEQLLELQGAFVTLTNDNAALTESLQQEQHLSRELATRLGQQEDELSQLRDLLQLKEKELRTLKSSYHSLTQDMFGDVEGSVPEERLRGVFAQSQLAEKLQRELALTQDRVNSLTSKNDELHILIHQAQAQLQHMSLVGTTSSASLEDGGSHSALNADADRPSTSGGSLSTDLRSGKEQSVASLHASIAQLESERNGLLSELDSTRKSLENLQPAFDSQGQIVTTEKFANYLKDMTKLEEKFNSSMRSLANLEDENEVLQHKILQLEGETETIGEYIALYQRQRALLQQRESAKEAHVAYLNDERETLRFNLTQLQKLVVQILQERGEQVPAVVTTMLNSTNNVDESLPLRDATSNENAQAKSEKQPLIEKRRDPAALQIMHLLSELDAAASTRINSLNDSVIPTARIPAPCKCCTGKLLSV